MTENYVHIPDINQNYWQLSCIQSAALGLPGMIVGGQLASQYGTYTAIASICTGNLILWGIAFAMVSMSLSSRENAIENIKKYVGIWPCIFASLVLTIGFLSWSMAQNHVLVNTIGGLAKWSNETRMGLGLISLSITAALSFYSIQLIKKVCVYVFPFLFLYAIYQSIYSYDNNLAILRGSWSISFFAVVAVVAQNLPGIVNLPTFFRHARSKQDARIALTLMTIFVSLFQIFSIVAGIANPSDFFSKIFLTDPGIFSYIFSIAFVILSTLCVNLVNIYFASAGWEAISNILRPISSTWKAGLKNMLSHILVPHGRKYAKALGFVCIINGLIAVLFYRIIPNLEQVEFLEAGADNSLASLGVVLILAFLTKIFENQRPKLLERTVSGICWFIGGCAAIYTQIKNHEANEALVVGVIASFLAYLAAIFIEVTYSATIWLFQKKK